MSEALSYKKIVKYWLPLSATWLMMSAEGPFLTAIIARMSSPDFNLAAYGVAYTIALIIESPVIMMLSASTALVEDRYTFFKLRKFVYSINFIVTVIMIIFLMPPIFNYFALHLIQLPTDVAKLTHIACIILIPWAPSIGYRRFFQGILIRDGLTRFVAYGTIIRLTTMAFTAYLFYLFLDIDGVLVGAASLSAGVIFEAAAARLMAVGSVNKVLKKNNESAQKISFKEIFHFYYPLALTSFISLGFQPVVTFFIGHSRNALESLAVFPVLTSFVFLFRSLGMSLPEVVIALIKTEADYIKLKIFSARLAVLIVVSLGIISFTPLAEIWFLKVAGISETLTQFCKVPLMLFTFFPTLTVWINFQRSILIYTRDTKPLTMGIISEVAGMFIVLFITVFWLDLIGITAAVVAMIVGRFSANLYLINPFNKAVKKIKSHAV